MMKNIALILLLLLTSSCIATDSLSEPEVSIKRQKQLMHLLLADCGSCHGMTLKGGLGPSLLAQDLKVKTNQQLFYIIKFGTTETPMPPWEQFLNDSEINWMINTLRQQSWQLLDLENKEQHQ